MQLSWLIIIGISFLVLSLVLVKYIEKRFKTISQEALSLSLKNIISLAKEELSHKQSQADQQLHHDKEMISQLVKQIEKQLNQTKLELTQLSKQTSTQFGALSQSLHEHRRLAAELKVSTDELKKLLSNNQRLGAWGERIAEDILKAAGLQKGIHYDIQAVSSLGRPDIVFKLPDNKVVNIDVKFPFKHLQAWLQTDSSEDKGKYLKKFREEVRAKIREIKNRGYVDPDKGTLDYAILFIPNEMVFGFINEKFGEVIDEAMANKIILASPFTLYAVARIIFESYRNFYYANNLKQIVSLINDFSLQWRRFKGDFDDLYNLFTKVSDNFDKIRDTRYRLMDGKIAKIQTYQRKQLGDEIKTDSNKSEAGK